jgi:hypothetical protein
VPAGRPNASDVMIDPPPALAERTLLGKVASVSYVPEAM